MAIGAYEGLWRPIDANGWLLVPMEAYGCNGWLLVPVEAYGCNGWLLVLVEAYAC